MAQADLLLTNAVIVTVDKERRVLFDGAMAVKKDRILEIGNTIDMQNKYTDCTEIIDCSGQAIFPGFINTHNHLFQTLLKGLGDDMVLKDWLATMTFPAAKFLQPDDCRSGAMLGLMEGIRSGMTTEVDYMYPHARDGLDDPIVEAYKEIGIRGIFGRGCMNTGLQFGVCPEIMQTQDKIEKETVRIFDKYHNSADGRIKVWTAPAALWSNTEENLKMLYDIANSYKAGITIHVSETPFDRDATMELHGAAGVDCLEKMGITGPNVLMVHCVYLTDSDIKKAREYDLKVSHNTVSNMYLASGVAPIPKLLEAGVTCSLGVDGAASNNGQDMLELMKSAALLQKVSTRNPIAITAEKILELATIDGARAIGMEDEIGSLEAGKKADFVIFDPYRSPKSIPMHNPVSTLVYSSTMNNIRSVAVDGKFVLRDGELTTVNEKAELRKGQAVAERLCEDGGITNRREGHAWFSAWAK